VRWKALDELLPTMQSTSTLHACTLSPTTNYNTRKTLPRKCIMSPTVLKFPQIGFSGLVCSSHHAENHNGLQRCMQKLGSP